MWTIYYILHTALGIAALFRVRWTYIIFVIAGLLYFPAKVGFHFDPHPCERTFNLPLAIHSLTNFGHIVLFAYFYIMTMLQFRVRNWKAYAWSAAAGLAMGVAVELVEGVTGKGHCRFRDLIPDTAGMLIGALLVFTSNLLIQKLYTSRLASRQV